MQEYNKEKIDEKVKEDIEEWLKAGNKPSVLICGMTGSGKTSFTLLHVFANEGLKVGENTEPCTRDIVKYPGEHINIYDSEGYETGSDKQAHYREMLIEEFLKNPSKQGPDGLQAVWYTIDGGGKKVTDLDFDLIKEIQGLGFPVCVLITKLDTLTDRQYNELTEAIRSNVEAPIFAVSTREPLVHQCDSEQLIDWTYNVMPESFRKRFIFSLKEGLLPKEKEARKAAWIATALAAAYAATPVPFAQAPGLIIIQTGLIYKILRIYNISVAVGTITGLLGSLSVAQAGRALAGELLKLIPGAGSIIGGMLNASVAAAFTYAIGEALIALCAKQATQMLKGKPVTIDLEKILGSKEFISQITAIYKQKKAHILDEIKENKKNA